MIFLFEENNLKPISKANESKDFQSFVILTSDMNRKLESLIKIKERFRISTKLLILTYDLELIFCFK